MRAMPLLKYNPQRMDPKELEAITIGREDMLRRLEQHLRREARETHLQHLVLVGPRGIGKTHLLTILHHRCMSQPDLSRDWLSLLFPEELNDVVDLRTLYRRILRELDGATGKSNAEVSAAIEDIESGSQSASRAAAFLKDFTKHRRLLLLLDNLDRVIGVMSSMDQKALRDVLMNEPFGLVIGGSLTVFQQHISPDQVFHHLFDTIPVQPLSAQDMGKLFRLFVNRYGTQELAERLNQRPACLDALWRITGGSPRLALAAYEVVSLVPEKMAEVVSYLEGIMDDMTPYFQDRLKELPDRERQLVDALASSSGPLQPAELAGITGLSAGQVRSHLSRLGNRGIAAPVHQTKQRRTKRYDLTERLFRTWYHWRLGGDKRQHVLLIVEILESLCTIPELRRAAEGMQITAEVKPAAATESMLSRQVIQSALERMTGQVADTIKKAGDLIVKGELSSAIGLLEEARLLDPENPTVLSMLGYAYVNLHTGSRAENLETAIECYRAAMEVRTREAFPEGWAMTQNNLGAAYYERIKGDRGENLESAIECYRAAMEVRTREAFPEGWAETQNNMGNAYYKRIKGDRGENLETAIECYRAAMEVYTREAFPEGWAETQNNMGNAYSARIKGDRGENLEIAIGCFEAARPIVERVWPWRMNDLLTNLTAARLLFIQHSLREGNIGDASRQSEAALSEIRVITDRAMSLPWLLRLFSSIIAAGEAKLAEQLLSRAREVLPESLIEPLFVAEIAVEYLKSKDPEVLDKLAPVVREAVEMLLKGEEH